MERRRSSSGSGAVRSDLVRLRRRWSELLAALREAAASERDTQTLGLSLAGRFPEIESLASLVAKTPDERELATGGAAGDPLTRDIASLVRIVEGEPRLSEALQRAFPHQFERSDTPRLSVFVADPVLDERAAPLRGRWPIQWVLLESRLRDAFRRTEVAVRVEFHPATWQRAVEIIPRADYVVLLAHGARDILAFEREDGLQTDPIDVATRLPRLFEGRRPDVCLVLSCHSEAAASAIHDAGVPYTIGVSAGEPVEFRAAVELAASFFGALASGQEASVALELAAASASPRPTFRLFRNRTHAVRRPPRGAPSAQPRDEWVDVAPREAFTGREAELAALFSALQRPGIIVLTGAPGVGKTELSRALLERARLRRWPADGSRFVSLEGRTSPEAVLASLAVQQRSDDSRIPLTPEQVGAALGAQERLIVLDNADDAFEDSAAARTTRAVLTAVIERGKARVVVTSRRNLRTPQTMKSVSLRSIESGADVVLLSRLLDESGPDAAARRQRLAADSGLPDLLALLDGHPLSLILAAARLADGEPPAGVGRALRERGHLRLPDIPDDEAERTGCLAAAIDLSFTRLQAARPAAVELWRIVADLPAGLPVDAELPPQDEDDLAELRRRSLVEERSGGWQSPAPFALYLHRRAAAPTADRRRALRVAVGRALANQLDRAAHEFGGEAPQEAILTFRRWLPAIDDLLTRPPWDGRAPDWAGRLLAAATYLAMYQGLSSVAWVWATTREWEADLAGGLAACQIGRLAEERGEYSIGRRYLTQALATLPADSVARAFALSGLADLDKREGRTREARLRFEEAIARFRERGLEVPTAETLIHIGDLAELEGRFDEAEQYYARAEAVFRRENVEVMVADALVRLGRVDMRRDRLQSAGRRYATALEIFRSRGSELNVAETLRALGDLHVLTGEPDAARRHYEDACKRFREIGHRLGEAHALSDLGALVSQQGELEEAQALLERALEIHRELGERASEVNTLVDLGNNAHRRSMLDDARKRFEDAVQLSREIGYKPMLAVSLWRLAEVQLDAERPREAICLTREAAGRAIAGNLKKLTPEILHTAARAHLAVGERAEALALLMQARGAAREARDERLAVSILLTIAETLAADGQDPRSGRILLAAAVRGAAAGGTLREDLAKALAQLDADRRAQLLEEVDALLDDLDSRMRENLPPGFSG